jgi:hypothetical protein
MKEGIILVYGGLRGGVGLALALVVVLEQDNKFVVRVIL